jgi:glycosyltransferase involved in cell wall biosynthesis
MGGAEAALVEMLAGLTEEHPTWRLGLIVASEGALVDRARALGVEVRVLPFPPALARLGEWGRDRNWRSRIALGAACIRAAASAWQYTMQLREHVQAITPDVLHTNGLKMHVLGAWAKGRRTQLVWHFHDYVRRHGPSAYALRQRARDCACVIVPSRSVAEDLASLGSQLPQVRTIWNAVDLRRFSPEGDTLDLDGLAGMAPPERDVIRVGLLATFARWKGHRVFLEAIARLPPGLSVRAYVIGGPIYDAAESQESAQSLQAFATTLGLGGRVGFTGYVESAPAAIRALDVLVHASTEPEPFGLAIAEGMACARAVVVSATGGAAEIVTPGVDALACAPRDAAGLARAIETLVSDPDLRYRLGQSARKTAERAFSRRRLTRELDQVYAGLAPSDALRVLHVHSGNLYGGVEVFLRTLAHHASAAPQMASSFVLCFEGALAAELRTEGHPPHLIGAVRVSRPHTVFRARRSLARLLERQRVDVVVCHQAWAYAIFGPTVRRAGLPLVFWQHTVDDGRHWLTRWARRLTPDLALSPSRFATERLSRWMPRASAETVAYPLNVAAIPTHDVYSRVAVRRSLDTSPGDLVIVQVGRLDPYKGYRETIEALASLGDVGRWTCWIVGGPQRAGDERYLRDLKALAEARGIADRVRFVGERRDIAMLLDAADIYCQPNIQPEAFGISFVEALAAGLPIVTSGIGGAAEIVTEPCGILVPPGDIGALSTALRRLLADADLRSRLGEAGRSRCAVLCDLPHQMGRIRDVLAALAARHGRRSIASMASALPSSTQS